MTSAVRDDSLRVAGIDGCKNGWVAVVTHDGRLERAVHAANLPDLIALLSDVAAIAIDIPIGSEPDRFRRVDTAARSMLGQRKNSVFLMPPFEVFRRCEYPVACKLCRELTGNAPSKQVWALREKIIEANDVASTEPRLIEGHPEVSFRALVGKPLEHGKKTWAGHTARRRALAGVGIELPDDLGEAGAVGLDDVLDAAVMAWTADRHARGVSKNVGAVFVDGTGRTVTIWY